MTTPDDYAPIVLPGQAGFDFTSGDPVFPCSVDAFTDSTGAIWGWECSGCGERQAPVYGSMPEAIAAGETHVQEQET